jgi:hypothetical protein
MAGQKMMTLCDELRPEGNHSVNFSTGELKNSIYILRLKACDQVISRKITVAY